jgi:hypothetical protein
MTSSKCRPRTVPVVFGSRYTLPNLFNRICNRTGSTTFITSERLNYSSARDAEETSDKRPSYLWRYVIRPFVRSYGESSNETLSPFMILIRLRRSLPAIVASTLGPDSSSIANIPALNFSTTLPNTSIASSFGKLFFFPSCLIWITFRDLVAIVFGTAHHDHRCRCLDIRWRPIHPSDAFKAENSCENIFHFAFLLNLLKVNRGRIGQWRLGRSIERCQNVNKLQLHSEGNMEWPPYVLPGLYKRALARRLALAFDNHKDSA